MLLFTTVFLTNPTIEELQGLDMPILLDMLTYQTNFYFKLVEEEGLTNTAVTCRDCIHDIQAVIQMKRKSERTMTDPASGTTRTEP